MLVSSVWAESQETRLVWITMLLLADSDGVVWGAVPGLAKQAGVSLEGCREALRILGEPDPDSRTQAFEGRRIITIEGGWRLVNAVKYRDMQPDGGMKDLSAIRAEAGRKGAEVRWGRDGKMANDSKPSQNMLEGEGDVERENRLTPSTTARERPANPLVSRDEMIAKGHRLITTIAKLEDLDPTEVLRKASRYKGTTSVRLDTMSDDWLAHTFGDLAGWERRLTGKKEPEKPKHDEKPFVNPKAQARQDAANAMIAGGLKHGRTLVGEGTHETHGEPQGPGPHAGDDGSTRRRLPGTTGEPDR